jgi:hypothetical protein
MHRHEAYCRISAVASEEKRNGKKEMGTEPDFNATMSLP